MATIDQHRRQHRAFACKKRAKHVYDALSKGRRTDAKSVIRDTFHSAEGGGWHSHQYDSASRVHWTQKGIDVVQPEKVGLTAGFRVSGGGGGGGFRVSGFRVLFCELRGWRSLIESAEAAGAKLSHTNTKLAPITSRSARFWFRERMTIQTQRQTACLNGIKLLNPECTPMILGSGLKTSGVNRRV